MKAEATVDREWGSEYDAECGQEICCDILPRYVSTSKVEDCYQEIHRLIHDFVVTRTEAQAEISFKAGEQAGFTKGFISKVRNLSSLSNEEMDELNAQAKAYIDAVKAEGIKEVVEWIGWQSEIMTFINMHCEDKWQAKLKEWRIEE